MRMRTVSSCLATALLLGACSENPSEVGGAGPMLFPNNVVLGLGKHQQFQTLVPDTRAVWSLPQGVDGGYVSQSGMYYAPLRPPAYPTIRVVATAPPLSAEATVQLTPTPADTSDCLAEQQQQGDFGDYVYVEELPEAIVKVTPHYPDSARVAGVDGTVMVQAHVCACGQVGETRIVRSIPLLDAAAATAVRQWVWKPALTAGEPVAVWVGVPVRFSLH